MGPRQGSDIGVDSTCSDKLRCGSLCTAVFLRLQMVPVGTRGYGWRILYLYTACVPIYIYLSIYLSYLSIFPSFLSFLPSFLPSFSLVSFVCLDCLSVFLSVCLPADLYLCACVCNVFLSLNLSMHACMYIIFFKKLSK